MKQALLNYALFQMGWFACVFGAAYDRSWLGLFVVLLAVTVHLTTARLPLREAGLLLICALIGLTFDSALLMTTWVSYPNGSWFPGLVPLWIVAMWVLFGTTLNRSLAWLRGQPWIAFLLGAIGGPLSYLAGERIGAIDITQPLAAMSALAVGWGLVLPLLFAVSAKLDGFTRASHPRLLTVDWRASRGTGHA